MNATEIAANFVKAASQTSGLPCPVILSRRKTRCAVLVRWAVWSALRDLGMTFMEIGHAFDRDHGSIIHGCQQGTALTGTEKLGFDRVKAAAKATLATEKPMDETQAAKPRKPQFTR